MKVKDIDLDLYFAPTIIIFIRKNDDGKVAEYTNPILTKEAIHSIGGMKRLRNELKENELLIYQNISKGYFIPTIIAVDISLIQLKWLIKKKIINIENINSTKWENDFDDSALTLKYRVLLTVADNEGCSHEREFYFRRKKEAEDFIKHYINQKVCPNHKEIVYEYDIRWGKQ